MPARGLRLFARHYVRPQGNVTMAVWIRVVFD